MKIFLTGATGYIGTAVAEQLRSAGHQVLGLARTPEKARQVETQGSLAHAGSLEDLDSLRAGVRASDATIHTAMRFGPEAGVRDRAAVEVMLAELEGSGKPFVYTSGVWVFGDTRGRMLGEIARLNPPPLVAWRPAVEEMVLEARQRGVRPMVLRPGMVFGRQGGAVGGFFRQARANGVIRTVGEGENYWSSVHIEDLAALYVLAVSSPAAGEVFIACGGMPQPVKKIALAVADACGLPGKVEPMTLEQARAQMGPMADCHAMDCRVASTKAARFFGWTVRKPSIFAEIESGSYLS
jgi:nucleoside-diphosphate-sugar epimerase